MPYMPQRYLPEWREERPFIYHGSWVPKKGLDNTILSTFDHKVNLGVIAFFTGTAVVYKIQVPARSEVLSHHSVRRYSGIK